MGPREWSAAIPFPVNFMTPYTTPGILPFGTEWYDVPDPNDLSYTLYAMYDSKYLYVAMDVAEQLKKTGKATIHNAIWLSWVELFQEIGSQMTGGKPR